jgi:hypothetical protein
MASEERTLKKAQKKQAKTQKKAAKKDYERKHAQPKRVATMSSALTAAQVKRNKSAAK